MSTPAASSPPADPMAPPTSAAPPATARSVKGVAPRWAAHLIAGGRAARDLGMGVAAPLVDLAARFWVAQLAVASGFSAFAHWSTVTYGALGVDADTPADVVGGWASSETLQSFGGGVEVAAGVLLALGLLTRPAALALLIAVLSPAFGGGPLTLMAVVMSVLLIMMIVFGAGALSLDRVLGRGAEALPLGPLSRMGAAYRGLTAGLGPVATLALRIWAAAVLASAALGPTIEPSLDWVGALSPPAAMAGAPTWLTPILVALAGMLAVGVLTRVAALSAIGLWLVFPELALFGPAALGWLLALGLVVPRGPGPISLDRALGEVLRWIWPLTVDGARVDDDRLPHVVIVGAGFGGVAAAKALRGAPCRVTVIDRRNYHLFQPLLYQVATAALSPADIATPIREIFRGQSNVRVVLGRVDAVDPDRREVRIGARTIGYDYLILATGARHSYFGRDEWEPYAPGLKKIDDATDIRRRVLLAFETAEQAETDAERQAALTFAVIGGGPTGVEMAGAIAELAHRGLEGEFRAARPEDARVLLIEGADRLLRAFPEDLAAKTAASLRDLGVEVVTDARVTGVDGRGVEIGARRIDCRTVVWAAGVVASPAAKWLECEADRAGRAVVDARLSPAGRSEIYVVGDTAASKSWDGQDAPGLAPAAKQGGAYAAEAVTRALYGQRPPNPFAYKHAGSLATIGRASAVADLNGVKFSGALAWWFWGVVHVLFLSNARSRIAVAIQWAWAYLTYRRSTRLITGPDPTME